MFLAVDIGNSNITLGIYDEDLLLKTFRINSDINLSQEKYEKILIKLLADYDVRDCAIVSVVDELSSVIKNACDNVFKLSSLMFNRALNYPLEITLKEPNKIGADRLINAYGASVLYKLPAIVVDVGTAITFDIVSKDLKFIGGIIMPGLNLQFKSLNLYTSKLPYMQADVSKSAIGDSTENAILSGVIRGTASAIEGLISQCELELKEKACVIVTGGQSSIISEYIPDKFDFVNPYLTLEGIRLLYINSHVNLY